jgi:hypothetical protein
MFGVYVFGLDLNAPTMRYFDVKMYEEEFTPLMVPVKSTEISLVQCTPEHIAFNDKIKSSYAPLHWKDKLCPNINQ